MCKTKQVVLFFLVILPAVTLFSFCSMPFSKADFTEQTSSLDLFSYDIENVPDVGTAYRYEKSNRNGSNKANVWIYIASGTHTESFKIYPSAKKAKATDLVIADYDSNGFFTSSIKAYLVSIEGERKLNVTSDSKDGKTYTVKRGSSEYQYDVGHTPTYNYNFDWCDFSFMYRHIIKKTQDFEIGVSVPNSFMKLVYAGKADFTYLGEIEHLEKNCFYYKVSGEAFRKEKGYVYFDSESGLLVEIDMPVKNNANYNSFKFTLKDSQKLSRAEWDAFIIEKTKEVLK